MVKECAKIFDDFTFSIQPMFYLEKEDKVMWQPLSCRTFFCTAEYYHNLYDIFENIE